MDAAIARQRRGKHVFAATNKHAAIEELLETTFLVRSVPGLCIARTIVESYWTEGVQVTNTDDRPDLTSEGTPDIDKTANVEQKLIFCHETQMGLETKTYWQTDRRS
jgi:hypothetical protein